MSDSFADLWNSTSTTNPKDIPLSQQKRGPTVQQKPTPDVFALLAQSSTRPRYGGGSRTQSSSTLTASSPGSRSLTPSYSGGNGVARPASSMSQSSTTKSGTGNDAFRDLFSGTSSSQSNGNTAHMTIAERAALVSKQRLAAQTTGSSATPSTSSNQWAGLDALGAGSLSNNSIKPSSTTLDDDDWGLGDFGTMANPSTHSKPTSQTKPQQADQDDWGPGDFAAPSTKQPVKQTSSQPTSKAASGSLWGLDGFSTPSQSQIHIDSPDFDFDFGNREDRDLSSSSWHHEGEDDILGMLSKPVETVRAKQQQQPPTNEDPPPPSATSKISRTSSPPPHILGQIVEMGFSVSQGKAALARTETGIDVQAALDILLAESNNDEIRRPSPVNRENAGDIPSRRRPAASQREGSTSGTATPNTEKLIAQASEIGLSVLSKASLFWKEGKERVQKAYEEANTGSTTSGTRDNRPKWMQEASESPVVERHRYGDASGFKDDDDYSTSAFADESAVAGSSHPIPPRHQPKVQKPEIDLFASAQPPEPKVYVSPFRRKKVEAPSLAPAPPLPRQQAQPPVPPKPKRRLPFCASSTLTRVQQHKTKGTESFKLGQFSIAAEEYTKAITLLPTGHLLLIPLQTNRAISQIRCGECKAAIQDASGALSIIGAGWESWYPNDEDGGWELENDSSEADGRGGYTLTRAKGTEWSDTWGRGVDLKDAWVKAVKRRAEAFEGLEKWKDALKDWEILAGGGGGGWVDSHTRQEAVRGIGRCKKMFDGDKPVNGTSNRLTTVKPRPRPIPTPQINAPPSVAVKAYRAQVSAAEAEDTLKHSLKDAVEAKILAWKKGKETNLRALLASLDTVLWEEVLNDMGRKPGMADLVSGGGVKKWYMKAVSRVHPDKLNANNSSVEQRMIAGGVFGALNEAWLAFKQ